MGTQVQQAAILKSTTNIFNRDNIKDTSKFYENIGDIPHV